MSRFCVLAVCFALAGGLQASWYWPFGSDETDAADAPRISTLMEPASLLIDEAADLAAEGKVDESVEKYRKALSELDRIEQENPERARSAEFATLRNKRAYVNAAIDSMLLGQVRANAKAVAISDTTALEKKLEEERAAKSGKKVEKKEAKAEIEKKAEKDVAEKQSAQPAQPAQPSQPVQPSQPSKPRTKREAAMQAIARGEFETADRLIAELLVEKPNSAIALNLKAVKEARQGNLKGAEEALDQAIMSNPRNPAAYYNMAKLMLQLRPNDKSVAKRYYETGRAVGGEADAQLEAAFK